MSLNARLRSNAEMQQTAHDWQRTPYCQTHRCVMRYDISRAARIKPQNEIARSQCFVCDDCEQDYQEQKQKQIASAFSIIARPDYRPGALLNAYNQASLANGQTRIRRTALAAIPTHDLLPAPQPTYSINPVTPPPETRQALFSDVSTVAESLILWLDDDEDATEMHIRRVPKQRDTAQIPVPHVEELLYELMHVPAHEQSTDENERLSRE